MYLCATWSCPEQWGFEGRKCLQNRTLFKFISNINSAFLFLFFFHNARNEPCSLHPSELLQNRGLECEWGSSAASSCLVALCAKAPRLTVPGLSLFSLRASNTTSRADGPEYEPCSQISVINMRRRGAKIKAKQNAVHARGKNFLIPAH